MDWHTAALWLLALQLWEMRAAMGRHRRQIRDALVYTSRDWPHLRRTELRRILGLAALLLALALPAGCGTRGSDQRETVQRVKEHSRPDGNGGTIVERETVTEEKGERETTLALPAAAAAGLDLASALGLGGGTLGVGTLAMLLLKKRRDHATSALERHPA